MAFTVPFIGRIYKYRVLGWSSAPMSRMAFANQASLHCWKMSVGHLGSPRNMPPYISERASKLLGLDRDATGTSGQLPASHPKDDQLRCSDSQ